MVETIKYLLIIMLYKTHNTNKLQLSNIDGVKCKYFYMCITYIYQMFRLIVPFCIVDHFANMIDITQLLYATITVATY